MMAGQEHNQSREKASSTEGARLAEIKETHGEYAAE